MGASVLGWGLFSWCSHLEVLHKDPVCVPVLFPFQTPLPLPHVRLLHVWSRGLSCLNVCAGLEAQQTLHTHTGSHSTDVSTPLLCRDLFLGPQVTT